MDRSSEQIPAARRGAAGLCKLLERAKAENAMVTTTELSSLPPLKPFANYFHIFSLSSVNIYDPRTSGVRQRSRHLKHAASADQAWYVSSFCWRSIT